jgi:hypothetical protein
MTSFSDSLKLGRAYYNRASTPSTGYAEDETLGVPVTQVYVYQIGQASTTATNAIADTTASGGAITATGALVSGGVATFDVARCVSVSSATNVSGATFRFVGTDAWGSPLTADVIGPNAGTSFSNSAFKTISSIALTAGTATQGFEIGNSDRYGLPYRIANSGKVIAITRNGVPVSATDGGIIAGLAATGTPTATTADVRGVIVFPTTALANGTAFLSVAFVTPNDGVSAGSDTKENTYGAAPFGS